jgi:hypothetical protein
MRGDYTSYQELGDSPSHIWFTQLATRERHPSATGGSTHCREVEQVKDGPGDVCNHLHPSFRNSAGHQLSGHDRGQNTGTELHYLYRINILNVDEFNVLLSTSLKTFKLKSDVFGSVIESSFEIALLKFTNLATSGAFTTAVENSVSNAQSYEHVL